MVKSKQKAAPGKRYCKGCNFQIPIHCRVCSNCGVSQYTIQQIAKEYRKRKKSNIDDKYISELEELYNTVNPFLTYLSVDILPIFSQSTDFLLPNPLSLDISGKSVLLNPLSDYSDSNIKLSNAGGPILSLSCAYRSESPYYIALSTSGGSESSEPLRYGKFYNERNIIQVYEHRDDLQFIYAILHTGRAALDLKWCPVYCNSDKYIGTLAAALGNGKLVLYNMPMLRGECCVMIESIEEFQVEGLIIGTLAWIPPFNKLAAGTQDGSIFIFSSGSKAPIQSVFGAHSLAITGMDASLKPGYLVSCGLDGYLKLWNTENMRCLDELCSSKRWSYSVCCDPMGRYVFYDNDGASSSHKVVNIKDGAFGNKKHINTSFEATLGSCYAPRLNYAFNVSSEGHISAVYVSEMEKSFRKRKLLWPQHSKLLQLKKQDDTILILTSFPSDSSKSSSSLVTSTQKLPDPETCISCISLFEKPGDQIVFGAKCGLLGVIKVKLEDAALNIGI
jgi:WD40 repeat protein